MSVHLSPLDVDQPMEPTPEAAGGSRCVLRAALCYTLPGSSETKVASVEHWVERPRAQGTDVRRAEVVSLLDLAERGTFLANGARCANGSASSP